MWTAFAAARKKFAICDCKVHKKSADFKNSMFGSRSQIVRCMVTYVETERVAARAAVPAGPHDPAKYM